MWKWIRFILLLLLLVIGYGAWTMWNPNTEFAGRQMGTVATDFKTLKLKGRDNKYLLLPEGFAGGDKPDATSPAFAISAAALANRAKDLWAKQARTELVRDIDSNLQFELVQRSAVFKFPDYVAIQAIDLGGGKAALAIYSRSKYGRSDFGVNKARIEAWLVLLKKELPN